VQRARRHRNARGTASRTLFGRANDLHLRARRAGNIARCARTSQGQTRRQYASIVMRSARLAHHDDTIVTGVIDEADPRRRQVKRTGQVLTTLRCRRHSGYKDRA
jgi:hypothetical protein